jgi:hypothetical protein
MDRLRLLTLFALFALFAVFCGPLAGSAAASSGTPPTVSGGFPPVIGAQMIATPSVSGDSVAWADCSTYQLTDLGTATDATYNLTQADAGKELCAYEIDGTSQQVVGISDPIGPVGTGPSLAAAGTAVTEGQPLAVTPGAWGLLVTPTDTWMDCDANASNCVPVASGATGTSYTVARSDVGSTIEVQESAPGALQPESTEPTGVVSATAPAITVSDADPPPTISGNPQVGGTLTASTGTWSNQPTDYTYQWDRCLNGTCTAIDGATGSTYNPVSADLGNTLFVYVAGAVYPGTAYGSIGSPYPSYPTNQVFGLQSSPPSTPAPTTVVPVTSLHTSSGAVGRLTATMRWTFRYAPSYTQIAALSVEGPALGATIATRCTGKGCPFAVRRIKVRELKRCRTRTTGHCRPPREVNLESEFHGHNLAIGSRVTVTISRPLDIGKYYRFVVRRRRAPSVNISCVAPGSIVPGKHCTGL